MSKIPSDALVYNGHSYYIYSKVADTWEDAQAYCEARGGHLAVITDAAENKALYDYKVKQGYGTAYFGFSDAAKEGTWTWVTGEPVTYTNWYTGEPNNGLGGSIENYAELWNGTNFTRNPAYTWNDGTFGKGAAFICEWEPEENSWTINGTTAKYGSTDKTLVTVKGVKSLDGLSLNDNVITVNAASLNKAKVSVSGDGYTLKLAEDVPKTTTQKAAWSLSGSTAIYKSSYQTAGYTLASNAQSITYSKATAAKNLATVQGAKSAKGLAVSGNTITLKNSALKNKVTISGGYEFNFAKDYKNATITGSKNADTITANGNNLSINGGAGNDTIKFFGSATTVTGGKGKDVFVYKSGNNVIADYAPEDTIQITSGKAKVAKSGSDVIFTVGKGKITIKGGANKTITYTDANGKHVYPEIVKFNSGGTEATILSSYTKNSFNIADYDDYKNTVKNINASSVKHDISITGNNLANKIVGGDGNDILIGGKGNDTLSGGNGADTFVYSNGEGNDLILDYATNDTIKIKKGTVSIAKSGSDVIFTVGSGKITVQNAADKKISYIDANGNKQTYGGFTMGGFTMGSAPFFMADDTDYELTPRNDLSSLVQSKAVDYSFANTSTELGKENNLIAYSGSNK